jgi:hypothetical protein
LTLTFLSIASAFTPKAIVEVKKDTGWYVKPGIWTLGVFEADCINAISYTMKAVATPRSGIMPMLTENTSLYYPILDKKAILDYLYQNKEKGLAIVADVLEHRFCATDLDEKGEKISLLIRLFDGVVFHDMDKKGNLIRIGEPIVSFATTALRSTTDNGLNSEPALYSRFLYHPAPRVIYLPNLYLSSGFESIVNNAYDRLEALPPCTHKLSRGASETYWHFVEEVETLSPEGGYLEAPYRKANIHAVKLAMLIHNLRYIYGETEDQVTIEKHDMDDAIVIVCESLQYVTDSGDSLL